MSTIEALNQYEEALKTGRKFYKSCVHEGKYPYLHTLDWLIDDISSMNAVNLGVIDIPSELIVGTRTEGRKTAFAGNFMPLMDADTEFAAKWISLCDAHLNEGIRESIKCYEYLGRFYVEEGNKRVSVLRSFNSPTVSGKVLRLIPEYSEDSKICAYYEFLDFYRLSKTYLFRFDRKGRYARLQAALGFDREHEWTENERRAVNSALYYFKNALLAIYPQSTQTIVSEAFLVWLQLYSLDDIREMTADVIKTKIAGIWPQVLSLEKDDPITVSTQEAAAPELNFFERLIMPSSVRAAFVHELSPEQSGWIRAHEEGRSYLEKKLRNAVTTRAYVLKTPDDAENTIEEAIKDGAKVIFTTTPSLITACRRIAAKYKDIAILNCSVSMPYPGVRTYYSRIYEGKFISGAIAGAISRSDTVGYIASNPIFGVPAGINAFAMGAMMTNPNIHIKLVWSCCDKDPIRTLLDEGITVISNRDVPTRQQPMEQWGLCTVSEDGKLKAVSSPYWNWGNFYVKVISSILNGSWAEDNGENAVNYWWGMRSKTVGVRLSDELPAGVKRLAEFLKRGMYEGMIDPFYTKLVSQDGDVINDGSRVLTTEELISMDWLCDCIDGHIPQFDELLPMSKEIVRLQGIYRGYIPPERGSVLL